MRLRNYIYKLFHEQKGSTAVIAAVAMVVLLGFSAFALDLGVSYNESSKLQNALDSAALAAVQELPADSITSTAWTNAENEAVKFASLNQFSLNESEINPIYQNNDSANRIIGIKIDKSMIVDYNFARVFGINSGTVARSSSAGLTPAAGVKGAVPLSISAAALNNAISTGAVTGLTIKCSSNANNIGIDCTGVSGWFGALRIDGSGASNYSNLLGFGYNGVLEVGQVLNMESGNMSGPTLDGFTTRYNRCTAGCTAEHYEPNCPRLVYVPVVQVLSGSQVKIVAFATFFLEGCGGNGNNSYIKATYVKDTVLPDASPGKKGQDFGLYISRLFD